MSRRVRGRLPAAASGITALSFAPLVVARGGRAPGQDRTSMYRTSVELHFLNVGHGDCTFVDLPSGRLMMIDINNSKSLPEDDVIALAERHGVSTFDFRYSRLLKGARSWQDYYGRSWLNRSTTTKSTSTGARSSATCRPTPTWTTCQAS